MWGTAAGGFAFAFVRRIVKLFTSCNADRPCFIEAMADPSRRRIAFNVVERNYRDQFPEADDVISLSLHLLGCVRSAVWSRPLTIYDRFEPMLDQELWKQTRRYA